MRHKDLKSLWRRWMIAGFAVMMVISPVTASANTGDAVSSEKTSLSAENNLEGIEDILDKLEEATDTFEGEIPKKDDSTNVLVPEEEEEEELPSPEIIAPIVDDENNDKENVEEEEIEPKPDPSADFVPIVFSKYDEYIKHIQLMKEAFLANPNQETGLAYVEAVHSLPTVKGNDPKVINQIDLPKDMMVQFKQLSGEAYDVVIERYAMLILARFENKEDLNDATLVKEAISMIKDKAVQAALMKRYTNLIGEFEIIGPGHGNHGDKPVDAVPDDYDVIDNGKDPNVGETIGGGSGGSNGGKLPPGAIKNPDGTVTFPSLGGGSTRVESKYKMEGNRCVKIDKHYKGKKLIKTITSKPKDGEKGLCWSGEGTERFSGSKSKPANVYNPYDAKERLEQYKKERALIEKEREKLALENNEILYTFNRFAEIPYYNATGVKVKDLNAITYDEAHDIFKAMSVDGNGQFVEEEARGLALVQGQVISIEQAKFPMSFVQLEEQFLNTTFDLRTGIEEKESGHGMLVIHASEVETDSINIKGKLVQFDQPIVVKREIALMPAEQVATSLGGTFVEVDNGFYVDIDGMRIEYQDGQAFALYRGQKIELYSGPYQDENGVWMAPINALIKAGDHLMRFENGKATIERR